MWARGMILGHIETDWEQLATPYLVWLWRISFWMPSTIWLFWFKPFLFGTKSHKLGNFALCLARHFSITIQSISKRFTVLDTAILVFHFLLCNLLDTLAPWPRKWGWSGPNVIYALLKWPIWLFSMILKVAIQKFPQTTSSPEMTPSATSGRQHIAQTYSFWVMYGSRFMKFNRFQKSLLFRKKWFEYKPTSFSVL